MTDGTRLAAVQAGYDIVSPWGRPKWMSDAACADHDPGLWFPELGESSVPAKKICAGCLVRDECLTYATDERIFEGVWGGMSPRDRQKLRTRAA